MSEFWENELPPKEALFTAREWLDDIDLSREDFALFGKHVANLWRAETGFVAAKITAAGKLRFAASGDAYTAVWQAWMDLGGVADGADVERQQEAAEAALHKLREEGLSELWRRVSTRVRQVVAAQPGLIVMNLTHVICRFKIAANEAPDEFTRTSTQPLLYLVSTHFLMWDPGSR